MKGRDTDADRWKAYLTRRQSVARERAVTHSPAETQDGLRTDVNVNCVDLAVDGGHGTDTDLGE